MKAPSHRVDSTQQHDRTADYPYGLPAYESEVRDPDRYLYSGKEFDSLKGINLYDFHARTYAPDECRFWQPDPKAGDYTWLSPYIYCHGDPINYFDRDGNREWAVDEEYNNGKVRHENNYGASRDNNTRQHKGIDINIVGGAGDLGAPVYATHDGIICHIVPAIDGNKGGIRISIKSLGGEIMTTYMHLNRTMPGLKLGQKVSEGQQIGEIGATGSTGPNDYSPHLHYEIKMLNKKWKCVNINPAIDSEHLIDAQKIINNIIFKGSELDGVTVLGDGEPAKIPVPSLTIKTPDCGSVGIHLY